ncbi:hypothetical protein ANN_04890 [Periplaneta americana]|uniref:Uncharacterized protein n=1 Tax=Periplaneta americana TaxID=6978 RepID=A0ABQ8TBP7_PERAM|nr:hypothetical protein ANN_04890 [Periplaneta americana]
MSLTQSERVKMSVTKQQRTTHSLSPQSLRYGLALRNARWFVSSWGKKFSHEISASVWDRCPPSIVMHLGSYDRYRNPVANTSYNGWGDHRVNHTIPSVWLDDRPPLLRHFSQMKHCFYLNGKVKYHNIFSVTSQRKIFGLFFFAETTVTLRVTKLVITTARRDSDDFVFYKDSIHQIFIGKS